MALLAIPGCTGDESGVADAIADMVRPFVDEVKRDALGNLICRKRGEGPAVMFAAHMDQIGLLVTDADEKGFLRVTRVGGLAPQTVCGRQVVFPGGVAGVVGRETDWEDDKYLFERLFVDIGAAGKAEAEKLVPVGSFAAVAHEVSLLQNGMIAAPAMDDRAGCAALVEMLRGMGTPACSVIAAFTSQEEVGLRGGRAAAWAAAPDVGVSLDVTRTGDTPKCARNAVSVGKGVAIKIVDSGMIASPALVAHMISLCEKRGIPFQREVLVGGTTDASAMQLAHQGVPAGCLSIPCRYVHSMSETISIADLQAAVDLGIALIQDPYKP